MRKRDGKTAAIVILSVLLAVCLGGWLREKAVTEEHRNAEGTEAVIRFLEEVEQYSPEKGGVGRILLSLEWLPEGAVHREAWYRLLHQVEENNPTALALMDGIRAQAEAEVSGEAEPLAVLKHLDEKVSFGTKTTRGEDEINLTEYHTASPLQSEQSTARLLEECMGTRCGFSEGTCRLGTVFYCRNGYVIIPLDKGNPVISVTAKTRKTDFTTNGLAVTVRDVGNRRSVSIDGKS